jgi:HprK-related kinase A
MQEGGLHLRTGPFVTSIQSALPAVQRGVALHYAQHPIEPDQAFADFHVSIGPPATVRRWVGKQAVFRFDGAQPFAPLPIAHGFPVLEWGLNWCVSNHCHQYLIVHAAVLEREGRALLLPAPSGSGKSTLCAGLAFGGGWRLLSDEMALIEPTSGHVVPLPRPVSLKNASIDVIREFSPAALFGDVVHETIKGRVVHVRPPAEGVLRADERALPAWVVLPRYVADAGAQLEPLSRARAFMALVDNAFNFNVHGRGGFASFARLIDNSDCHTFTYSNLHEAIAVFDQMAKSAP